MSRMQSINLGGGGASTIVVPTFGDLPAAADLGQFALVLADNTVYVWDGNSWELIGGQGNLLGHAGSQAISNGSPTVSVVYPAAMPDLNYSLTLSITNTVDADPIYLIIVSTTKTVAGFTAEFNAPTDSANYVIEYKVARDV